jgi:recombination protein U
MGAYRGRPLAFDAKHSQAERIRYDRVEPHQAQFLTEWQEIGGGISFILVGYKLTQIYAVPWDNWKACLDLYHKGGPASIKITEIKPDFTAELGKRVAIDYLTTIDRLFF